MTVRGRTNILPRPDTRPVGRGKGEWKTKNHPVPMPARDGYKAATRCFATVYAVIMGYTRERERERESRNRANTWHAHTQIIVVLSSHSGSNVIISGGVLDIALQGHIRAMWREVFSL